MEPIRTVEIYGLPIWHISVDDLCAKIRDWAESGQGRWIATLNLEYLSRVQRDPGFKALLSKANVFTADGMPILWACRQLDPAFKTLDRTTGADLTPKLINALDSSMIAIIGGQDPKRALRRLGKNPDDYYVFDGKVDLDEAWIDSVAEDIADRRVVLVGLGCPKREELIELLQKRLPNQVFVGVGGSFEMIAGIVKRAPLWMQKVGLEWFYRLAREPKRLWRRYLLEYPPAALALYKSIKQERRTLSSKLPPA